MKKPDIQHIIDRQFELNEIESDYNEILNWDEDVDWFIHYTTTPEKEKEFDEWLVNYLHKECKINKKLAKRQSDYFIMAYGLKTE